jgi:putative oxidoreductase
MPAFIAVGRVLFSVLFIVSGAFKLFDIAGTAQGIASKVVIPTVLASFTTKLEGLTGMPTAQMLAIAVGALELVCGVFIALNVGARFFSLVLAAFVIAATFYFHDFWNQTEPESKNNMIHALKNLSLIGALFIIAGIGRPARTAEPVGGPVSAEV